jgi:hypothetical protein
VTGASSKRRQGPRAVKLLAALTLATPAYKRPRRSNGDTHLTPSYLPDIAAHPLSLCFAIASHAGKVLDKRSAAAFDHLGARRCWES